VVFAAEDVHVSVVPVVVSFRIVAPDLALMTLPGLTVHEVAATAEAVLRPIASAAATGGRRNMARRVRM